MYTVNESIGKLVVYVTVLNPPVDVELFTIVDLTIRTISINASKFIFLIPERKFKHVVTLNMLPLIFIAGGSDYEELTALNADVFLPFDDDNRRLMFSVTIIDDDLFESVEEFNMELRFDPFGGVTAPPRVILSPDVSRVRIIDD